MAVIRLLIAIMLLSTLQVATERAQEPECGPRMDGSTAGDNAVTIESLEGAEIV